MSNESIVYLYPNIELSQQFYLKFSKLIQPKSCYDNVANIFLNYLTLENEYPNIQIVFGGVQIPLETYQDMLFTKHCFFRLGEEIIDPTLYKLGTLAETNRYFSILEYSCSAYRTLLDTYQNTLPNPVMRRMNDVSYTLLQKQIMLVG